MFTSFESKFNVLVNKCCSNRRIKPTPHSIADNIKKKKVNDKIFKLSKANPTNTTTIYKVTHNNSAVKSRCRVVFVFTIIVPKIKKKKRNSVFKSPKNKINKAC